MCICKNFKYYSAAIYCSRNSKVCHPYRVKYIIYATVMIHNSNISRLYLSHAIKTCSLNDARDACIDLIYLLCMLLIWIGGILVVYYKHTIWRKNFIVSDALWAMISKKDTKYWTWFFVFVSTLRIQIKHI